jgi:two-component system response regulator AtoC
MMPDIHKIFFSHSPKMEKIKAVIDEIARTDIPVLIQGESGTGKEIVAQAIYLNSHRSEKPFIKINCPAIPLDLLESELFGYERGAFTGAHLKKPGKFELADGGTILLNEIGEVNIVVQAKLLQVLQDGAFSRLGGNGEITVRTRVITTTKDHLEESMREGRFREDLFFRINVMNIIVPPLRERREQICPLSKYFCNLYTMKYAKSTPPLSPKTIEIFHRYDWPGNIRELENAIKRIVLFGEEELVWGSIGQQGNGEITPFSAESFWEKGSGSMEILSLKRVKSEAAKFAEKEVIHKALQETRWNRKKAAEMLGVSYKALLYKMHKHRMGEI